MSGCAGEKKDGRAVDRHALWFKKVEKSAHGVAHFCAFFHLGAYCHS